MKPSCVKPKPDPALQRGVQLYGAAKFGAHVSLGATAVESGVAVSGGLEA